VLIVTAPPEIELEMISPSPVPGAVVNGNVIDLAAVLDDDARCERCGYRVARCPCRQGPKIKTAR
jgi:hypothetical protein